MQQKNMLTQQDLKLIDEMFDEKFEKNAQEIIGAVNLMIDPMAKDIQMIKKQLVILNDTNIIFRNDLALTHKRIDNLEIAWADRVHEGDFQSPKLAIEDISS